MDATQQTAELPLRPQDELECRRCDVHCDKVVYPAACIEKSCPFAYSIEEFGHRYVGCMQQVFDVEIDVDLLAAAERTRAGFGAVKTVRRPLPMCTSGIDPCYESRVDELGCLNPEFKELPVGEPTFKIFARISPAA
jgi:hypothetical protein